MHSFPTPLRWGRRNVALGAMAAACALFTSAASAQPQPPAPQIQIKFPQAEVLVLHGTDCPERIVDPSIGELPPLRHNCWKVLDRKNLQLDPRTPASMVLANGRTFQIAYNGMTADRPPKHRISTSISKTDGPGFNPLADFAAEPGRKFHVGGFVHQRGTLLLAIRILP